LLDEHKTHNIKKNASKTCFENTHHVFLAKYTSWPGGKNSPQKAETNRKLCPSTPVLSSTRGGTFFEELTHHY